VNVEAPEMVAALERGNIDAFAVWEPWPTRAMRAIQGTRILVNNETIQVVRNYVYMNRGWVEANRDTATRFLRALVEATAFIESDRDEAVRQVARFLRQDRGLMAELMGKVGYRMDLTADSVANIQLAIDQLRGMGRLAKEVTPAQVIWPDALRAAAPDRVKI
jgi:NitT/TauT family transport system substrate-binding protein